MSIYPESKYEEDLLKEVKGLSEAKLQKIIKTVHFLKEEIINTEDQNKDTRDNVKEIMKFAAIWSEMEEKEVKLFKEIIMKRDKFSEGRFSL